MRDLRDRILALPSPWWLLSSCKPFAPWCLIDDLAHSWFPMTLGHPRLQNWPIVTPWCCRIHDAAVERYWRKENPEYFA